MSDDLIRMDAVDLIDGYRQGRFSPVDATAAVLARIHAVNDKINAFMIIDDEGAMAAARESEARWSKGAPKGLIDGVPTTIKDLMLTKGWPTLKGSLTVDPAGPWDEDAPCVARLREHGAVLLGKTTTPEVGWKGITDSALSGITRNPWNLAKTPGGSSGGASAALAANMGPLAVGSDGGGSIRIPSGFAGVFGLKPNYGRVPVYPESAMRNLSHIGPMTRSVADAALMLNVLAEPDYRDPTALPYQAIDFTKGLDDGIAGLKIAFSPDLGYANVDPEVAGIVAEAVTAFTELGATVERRDPGFDNPKAAFRTLWWAGAAGAFAHMPDAQKAKLEPELAQIVAEGQELSAMDYMRALEGRTDLCMRLRAFFQDVDLLLTPSLAVPAFDVELLQPPGSPADNTYWTDWTPFTIPFNLGQQPACSIPCGFTAEGLPVGLQIVADNFREDLVLRAAKAFEGARPINRQPDL
ncbi:MAG: amidase [Rhodospirillaceae bacterium]|jgi:aspartyl-tRNA(Asn)/glutamyl-tRNA(Gln) amidotransferase subunit A|nr:amidase [Rhodospirillaceae bacterium]MBT3492595.1 amidase [Rhodospirillaceae bacterium]MBT3782464.1 amidase [Rhodospirillaceae bacterium]MBT3978593.1 amidase [Rhodospirillaceae bacterium]MBT4168819.1 amidase [Rhodospirillaceae bacterium]